MKLKKSIVSQAYLSIAEPDYERGIERMKSHGFDCMDFSDFCNTDIELFKIGEAGFEKKLKEFSRSAARNGVEIVQCHGPWRYPPRDIEEEDRAERFEVMSKSIRGAAVMGCPNIVIHPIMPFGVSSSPEINPDEMKKMNFEFFSRLSEVGKEYGVTVCLENMPFVNFSLSLMKDILPLVKGIDSPYMRVCVDTGHSNIFTNSADDIRLVGKEYLAALHLHDNSGKRDEHKFPYDGTVDWEDVCSAIREIGYEGAVNFETYVKGKYSQAIREQLEIGFNMITDDILSKINSGVK